MAQHSLLRRAGASSPADPHVEMSTGAPTGPQRCSDATKDTHSLPSAGTSCQKPEPHE